jgi:ferric-dicitrate binding protein FerR (iron transport regulator)
MSDLDKSLEQLLSKASPRPLPDEAATAAAKEAVRAQWQAVSGTHQSRRKMLHFALAASILISVFALFNTLRAPSADAVRVASIQKSFGSIYVIGDQAELTRADGLSTIHEGQSIVTGANAGIALAWGAGGSVRLDKNTEVEFTDKNSVYLTSGRIYFDSIPSTLIAGIDAGDVESFKIETEFGVVSHIGTQFMAEVASDELPVSVREGKVDVKGRYYPHIASRGEQVLFVGRQRPVVLSLPEYGDAWNWIGRTTPTVDVDGQSVHAFLGWVGREMGMSVQYLSDDVEQLARGAILEGRVDSEPREALRLRMLTAALDWRYEEGVIYVSQSN